MINMKAWIAKRATEDDRLYEQYGKLLEQEHRGRFVAISFNGKVILGEDELTVAQQAVQEFGAGTFALRRIGYAYDLHSRRSTL